MTPPRSLNEDYLVWDNHSCMPLTRDCKFLPQLERHRKAGVSVVSLNVGFATMNWHDHLLTLATMRRWIALHSADYVLATNVDDILTAFQSGKLAIVFDIEGMGPAIDDINLVQTFYELGVRWMLLTYNRNNAAGGGCLDKDEGLTETGRTIIDEMARVGMVLCLSHVGWKTAAEAIDYSTNPVIFSHSNPFECTQHPRNIPNSLISLCASRGGVIGVTGPGPFLGTNSNLPEKFITHVQYLLDLVGPDHIGIGLDYVFDRTDGDLFFKANPELIAPGLSDPGGFESLPPEGFPAIAELLSALNLPDADIGKILGLNWLRIARKVWK